MKKLTFHCNTCHQTHEGLPDIAFQEPAYTSGMEEKEKTSRVKLDTDLCMLDNEQFFVRCVLEIPLIGQDSMFGWGVWVSASKENFERYARLSAEDKETSMNPWVGWLSNQLLGYEDTLKLKARVHRKVMEKGLW